MYALIPNDNKCLNIAKGRGGLWEDLMVLFTFCTREHWEKLLRLCVLFSFNVNQNTIAKFCFKSAHFLHDTFKWNLYFQTTKTITSTKHYTVFLPTNLKLLDAFQTCHQIILISLVSQEGIHDTAGLATAIMSATSRNWPMKPANRKEDCAVFDGILVTLLLNISTVLDDTILSTVSCFHNQPYCSQFVSSFFLLAALLIFITLSEAIFRSIYRLN